MGPFKNVTFIERSECWVDVSKESRRDAMHSSGPVLLGMGAYIACISAEIVLEVPATLKLMQKVRVKVKHDVQQFLIVFGSILVLAKFNCD